MANTPDPKAPARVPAEDAIPWACPGCGAKAGEHGRDHCRDVGGDLGDCSGFVCECDHTEAGHGDTYATACREAFCYHCQWSGTHPEKPEGLAAWESKALDAGWTMPATRRKELGI